ncbi:SRPBCC family protein [Streptomyces sp. NPDC051776]|uniref:SRPBCC family protein n=1 Tax=Streptomyces sp. NPDC051776 TaxID=3155414 RepID=UPI00341D8663
MIEYLFHPDALSGDHDLDPIVDFNELVGRQDNDVCERVQRGVRSRAFDHGLLPAKDSHVILFEQRYLRDRDGNSAD